MSFDAVEFISDTRQKYNNKQIDIHELGRRLRSVTLTKKEWESLENKGVKKNG